MNGDYAQSSTGELDVNIAGPTTGAELVVTGGSGASLGGVLSVNFVGGYVPTAGDTFAIVTYGSETGTFTLQLPIGISGTMAYGATTAVLTIGLVAPTLQSIAVTPANPSIAAGTTQQFSATGTYSDASTADLTGSVTWSSGTSATATSAHRPGPRRRRRHVQHRGDPRRSSAAAPC